MKTLSLLFLCAAQIAHAATNNPIWNMPGISLSISNATLRTAFDALESAVLRKDPSGRGIRIAYQKTEGAFPPGLLTANFSNSVPSRVMQYLADVSGEFDFEIVDDVAVVFPCTSFSSGPTPVLEVVVIGSVVDEATQLPVENISASITNKLVKEFSFMQGTNGDFSLHAFVPVPLANVFALAGMGRMRLIRGDECAPLGIQVAAPGYEPAICTANLTAPMHRMLQCHVELKRSGAKKKNAAVPETPARPERRGGPLDSAQGREDGK